MPFPPAFFERYGPWAVVTGASSGIGEEFARQLGQSGLSLVLVARRADRLEKLAHFLRETYPIQVLIATADLATPEGRDAVIAATVSLDVGLLVNNAGVEAVGSFFKHPTEKYIKLIEVNCVTTTALAHAFGRQMADRGKGGIIFTSSMAGKSPMPWFAVYSASKLFVSGLAVLIREELKPKGVDVLALEPGAVTSEMSARTMQDFDFAKLGFTVMPAEECVQTALNSLWAGRGNVVPGLMNKVALFVTGFLPQWLRLRLVGSAVVSASKPELLTYS